MSSTHVTATFNFLTDAGHLLATTAPEISAFLMNQRGNLLFENNVPQSDVQRQHVCSCCGHIMVPGNGSTLKMEHKRSLDRKSRLAKGQKQGRTPSSTPSGPTKVIKCGNCDRFTKINLPAPAPVLRRKIKKEVKLAASTQAPAQMMQSNTSFSRGTPNAANANSKKRAKSRKAGLQALLDQKKASQSSGFSLADFMRK